MGARLPFKGLSAQAWVNLALTSVLCFYVAQVVLDVLWRNTCGHLGTDFCAYWSAGRLANERGYAQVYDLRALGELQLSNLPGFADPATFAVSPVGYLPIFLPPFQLLALIPPVPGFWVWTVLNAVAFSLYVAKFHRSTLDLPISARLLLMLTLSLPVYWNFLDGQVNVWLMICVGEYIRLYRSDKPFRAGLWLGGLLLKPQTLLLLGPAMLLKGGRKLTAGLGLAVILVLGGSLVLAGPQGTGSMLQVWLGLSKGMPTTDVHSMMNWRMLAFHLAHWFSAGTGQGVAAIGAFLTLAVAVRLWRRPMGSRAPAFAPTILATLAATTVLAWHSHIHMAMILIPPLVILQRQESWRQTHLLEAWVLVPAAAYVLVFLLAACIHLGLLSARWLVSLYFFRGAAEFCMSIWILVIVVRQSHTLLGESAAVAR